MAKPHVLIIDDEPLNIAVLGILLAQAGAEYTALESSKGLWEIADSLAHVDIIFLDLELRNDNGFDVLKEIKADGRFSQVPIAACTVHLNAIERARQDGFDSFLGKPLSTQKFADQLRRMLDGKQVWEV
jgi:two-component system cell cycle response regulator DivK